MSAPARRVAAAFAICLVALAVLLTPAVPVRASSSLTATLGFSVLPGAYNNSVHIADSSVVNHPRLVTDRWPSSPYNGTVYSIGLLYTNGYLCEPLIVTRSLDGGRSFEAPRSFSLCLAGGSVDAVVAPDGAVYVATPGPSVYRSTDRGTSWNKMADVANQVGEPSLALDPVTGFLYLTWYWIGDGSPFAPQFSVSRDGGVTWSVPEPILPAGEMGTSVQVTAYGHTAVVSLVHQGVNNTTSTVVAVTYVDDGINATAAQPLSPTTYCMLFAAPAVAVSPGGVFAVSWYADPAYSGTGCWDGLGNTTQTWVSASVDGGRTFSAPHLAGGPPGWPTWNFGHTIAFDNTSRLYVAWWATDTQYSNIIYVASSNETGANVSASPFSTSFMLTGGNSSGVDSLSMGPGNEVFLGFTGAAVSANNTTSAGGVYLRDVTGGAAGQVVNGSSLSSLQVGIRSVAGGKEIARLPWTGTRLAINGLASGEYEVWVYSGNTSLSAGTMPVRVWGLTAFTVTMGGSVGPPNGPPGGEPSGSGATFPWLPVAALAVLALLASVVLASLYHTRLVREEVLQRKVRLLLYEYIRDHPGASFTEVRDAAGLQNGIATYHLGVLEKQGLLHSESRRRHRWYYSNDGVSLWREIPLSPFQRAVVEEVQKSPGIGVRELARQLGRRASSVGYNVRTLSREGILRTERDGTRLRCFTGDEPPSTATNTNKG